MLDLFSGIGGFSLAAQRAGLTFDHHFHSEIEPYCCKVMAKHFPQSINLGDIKRINGEALKEQYGPAWCITGGFPCQDLSTAGKGKGIAEGTRSGLWFEYARLIRELRPSWCIIENVRALCSRGLDIVLSDLSACGYDAEWRVLRACDVGLPHNRQRVFLIAYSSETRRRWDTAAHSLLAGREVGDGPQPYCSPDLLAVRVDWLAAQAEWEEMGEPFVYRDADGLPKKLHLARIAALGNSIVPQIAEAIMRRIKALEDACKSLPTA